MTESPGIDAPANPRHRSRWRRFSPSMGWQAFWSEIVIVGLGVAIALAANEAVEDRNWRSKVRDADARLAVNVESAFMWSAEQYVTLPCINAQLDALARRVMDSGATLTPAPVYSALDVQTHPSYVIRTPTKMWQFPAWEALVANGTATHFSPQLQDRYNDISGDIAMAKSLRNEANQLTGRLRALSYPMDLDPGARREFLVDIESLRRQHSSTLVIALRLMRETSEAGIAPKPQAVDAYVAESGTRLFCKEHGLPVENWRDYRGKR